MLFLDAFIGLSGSLLLYLKYLQVQRKGKRQRDMEVENVREDNLDIENKVETGKTGIGPPELPAGPEPPGPLIHHHQRNKAEEGDVSETLKTLTKHLLKLQRSHL